MVHIFWKDLMKVLFCDFVQMTVSCLLQLINNCYRYWLFWSILCYYHSCFNKLSLITKLCKFLPFKHLANAFWITFNFFNFCFLMQTDQLDESQQLLPLWSSKSWTFKIFLKVWSFGCCFSPLCCPSCSRKVEHEMDWRVVY